VKGGSIYIGTSGWHYRHWVGKFYPDGVRPDGQFEYYRKYFTTVEVNNSFYRLPSAETFERWKKGAFPGFLFAVKASRYITHMKKLTDVRSSTRYFFENVVHLGRKLGPILFQLPPGWKCNAERLSSFVGGLPSRHKYAFEFRNSTWYNDEVYRILRKHNSSFCIYELAGHVSPDVITANFVYVRLHGPGAKYAGSYSNDALQAWADKCRKWKSQGLNVFVYFDNDADGYAVFNAMTLKKMVM
jgi:uncharacterized protein YecE (DUF72 family)